MKYNKKQVIIALLVLASIIVISYDEYRESKNVLLEASYIIESTNNFIKTSGCIESASYYGNEYMTDDAKVVVLEKLARELGITGGLAFFSEKKNGREIMTLSKKGVNSETLLSVVTIEEKDYFGEDSFAQYITCKISIDDSPESICYYANVLKGYLNKIDVADNVTTTLIGFFAGELDEKKRSRLTDTILDSMNADIVAENRTKELFSVYAYADSAITDTSINLGSIKTNVNIAINYNESLDQTRIYLATPILNIEY